MIKANGGTAYGYTVDLCSKDKIYECAEEVKKDVGVVKILINNAGIVSGSSLLETPDEKIIRTFQVNVFAQFWTMKSFMPDMIKVVPMSFRFLSFQMNHMTTLKGQLF